MKMVEDPRPLVTNREAVAPLLAPRRRGRRALAAASELRAALRPTEAMSAEVAFGRGPQAAPVVRRKRKETREAGPAGNITHPSVAFVFDPERDSRLSQPYWVMGDDTMETELALAQRSSLRTHPAVQDALRRLGNAAFERDGEGLVSQAEYTRVHARMSQVLAPSMSEAEAAEAAAKEWVNDSGGQDRIDDSRINEALFQLVDLWCQTMQPEEYLSFLEALRFKLRFSD